jgi:maleylpyruvate isomerase
VSFGSLHCRFEVDLSPYPTLMRVEEALNALPALRQAHPDAQPDAPK